MLISLAFWVCLFVSVFLYALVALSPKVVRCAQRAEELARMQQHLCDLRRQVDFGERLTQEWASHPEFQASLTRGLSTAAGADGRRIFVEEGLRFQDRPTTYSDEVHPATSESSQRTNQLPLRIAQAIAGSRLLQAVGLTLAAALLVAAFTFLTDESARLPSAARLKLACRRALSRRTPDVR
jgi:hypothetical protein